jgi:hypothetical protein
MPDGVIATSAARHGFRSETHRRLVEKRKHASRFSTRLIQLTAAYPSATFAQLTTFHHASR